MQAAGLARPPMRLAITITMVVRATMVRLSTAMAPTSPLSLRSKISTDSTLVSEVNRITAALELADHARRR